MQVSNKIVWQKVLRKKCSLCISSESSESDEKHCTLHLKSISVSSKAGAAEAML